MTLRRTAAALALVALPAMPAAAQYQTVSLAGVTNAAFCAAGTINCLTFPSGMQTLGGIPFDIDQGGATGAVTRGWFGFSFFGPNPREVTIPVGVFGVTDVYTLINTVWGETVPGTLASIRFLGTGGLSHAVALDGNDEIRDYNQGGFANLINGTTTVNVFDNGLGQRLDRQRFALPAGFATETLTSIVLTDVGADGVQRLILTGVTVSAVPEPATVGLVAVGLALLGGVARRRARG